MPLSTEKPLQHESSTEFRRGDTSEPALAKEQKLAGNENLDSKHGYAGSATQRESQFSTEQRSDSQGSYSTGHSDRFGENAQYSGTTQRYDATLPATIIVEREKEPTRTIVEYEQHAPEYSEGHRGASAGQTFEQSIIEGHHRHHEPKVEKEHEGLFYRPAESSGERQQGGAESTVPLSTQGNYRTEGLDSRQQGQRLSDDARLEEQGKHFEGMMEQEVKDERNFEAGRESMRPYATGSYATGGSPAHHHHHHHHHHSSSHHSKHEDERGAGSDRGLERDSSRHGSSRQDLNDVPQQHSTASGYNADETQPKPAPSGAAQPPPFNQDAPAPLTDKAPAAPKDAFPEHAQQPKKEVGSSNIADTNRRDDNVSNPNPNTTGGQAGNKHSTEGGATSGKGLPPAPGSAGLPIEGGSTGATGATGLPKEGGSTTASAFPKEGTAPDKPKDTTSTTAKPGSSLNSETDKDKTGLPKSSIPPADKAPVDAKIDAEKKGLPGAAPTTTVPSGKGPTGVAPVTGAPGVPPGSTAPLPPPGAPAGSSSGLEKDEEEEHHGMKGKMHDMKEKMKDALHIGHHDKEKSKHDDNLAGGPVTDSHG